MKPKLITKLGRERMQRMIAYLRELPPERFCFGSVIKAGRGCGTIGCVIGHTPIMFPELVQYEDNAGDGLRSKGGAPFFEEIGEEVFQVSYVTSEALFTPRCQYSLGRLGLALGKMDSNASPTEVADMLESFLSQVDDIEEPARPA